MAARLEQVSQNVEEIVILEPCDSKMDLENDENSEHLTKKIVHSKSMGDLSPEEDRAKLYKQDLTSSESFNNFLYWREPLPVLDELEGKNPEKKGTLF